MQVYRLGVKFFIADSMSMALEDFIPIFHGWIQKQNVTGHLLVDVHNYSHMHNGPGILLVGHEGNFSLDMADGRAGLLYYRKAPTALAPAEHVASIIRSALQACELLKKDARLSFNPDEFVIVANDRLHAANDDATMAELKPIVSSALQQIWNGTKFELTRTTADPKERFSVTCRRS
jgi:hypothetical protein